MKIIDIIKEKYKVARKYYETYKHTTECSYYMGYMDALGELLERLEQEEKKIPEKIKDKYCSQISKVELAQKYNELIDYLDYLKSKGDE